MYDTEMIKDFETKFQSAALVELLKEPLNMLVVLEVIDTWRLIDEFLIAEKAAYDQQYAVRLEQLKVTIPVIVTANDRGGHSDWLKLIGMGLLGAAGVGYILWQLTPSQAAKRAEAKTRKIIAKAKRKVAVIESENKVKKEILKGRLERKQLVDQYKENESSSTKKNATAQTENTGASERLGSQLAKAISKKLERRKNVDIYQQGRDKDSEMFRRGWIPIALTS